MDTLTHTYYADNKHIQYTGRIDFTDPLKPRFSAPGVYIQTKFIGIGCSIILQDQFIWNKDRNFYQVIIDDTIEIILAPEKDKTVYPIISNLPYGIHNIMLVKRSESESGYCDFMGFIFSGVIQVPNPRPTRKIEFIGNSISCGSGIEAVNESKKCEENCYNVIDGAGWGQPYHNAYKAFGPCVARELNAEYHLTSVSGIGLVRNYSTKYDTRTMQQVYNLQFLEVRLNAPKWDVSKYIPDVIVIELGTNDFCPDLLPEMDSETFTSNYISFIDKLKTYYPKAHFFCLSSPMMGIDYPPTITIKKSLTDVKNHFKAKGDNTIHKFYVTPIKGLGCGTHPDTSEHRRMAAELAPFIKSTMKWD